MIKTKMIEYIESKLDVPILISLKNVNTSDLKLLYQAIKKVK